MPAKRPDPDPDLEAPEDGEEPSVPRAFWSGTLTFGLVSVQVELFPAVRRDRTSLRTLAPDGTPLRREFVCSAEGTPLTSDELVHGYEAEKDRFVPVTDEELEAIAPELTREIDLRSFVPVAAIPPAHFERGWFLIPGGRSTKPYRLLAGTMEEAGRAGIATFVMRGKEHLVAIVSEGGILRAETLRFQDEVRTADDLELPAGTPAPAAVKRLAAEIGRLEKGALDPRELQDPRDEALRKLVEGKRRKREDVVTAGRAESGPAEEPVDLLAYIKERLEKGTEPIPDRKRQRPPKPKKPRRRPQASP